MCVTEKSLRQISPDDTSEVAGWLAKSVELAGRPAPTTRGGTDPASRPATSEVSQGDIDLNTWCVRRGVWVHMLAYLSTEGCYREM